MGNRPMCEPVLAMESHEINALREDNLIVLIHLCSHIGPVEKRVVIGSRVDQAAVDLHI